MTNGELQMLTSKSMTTTVYLVQKKVTMSAPYIGKRAPVRRKSELGGSLAKVVINLPISRTSMICVTRSCVWEGGVYLHDSFLQLSEINEIISSLCTVAL